MRDCLWLWCHIAGSHNHQHGLTGVSTITPLEAVSYLDVPNALMVRYEMQPEPPFEPHAQPLAGLKQVVWSVEGGGGGDVDPVLALAGTLPNLRGIILDDYISRLIADPNSAGDSGPFSLSSMNQLRRKLDACRPRLDAWMVLYMHELDQESVWQPHLELCDVVTLWSWNATELDRLEQNFARAERLLGGKRLVLGLYMWDYGAKQAMPVEAMERQCRLARSWLEEGRIEGMILLPSCICDLGLETVDWTRQWIKENAG